MGQPVQAARKAGRTRAASHRSWLLEPDKEQCLWKMWLRLLNPPCAPVLAVTGFPALWGSSRNKAHAGTSPTERHGCSLMGWGKKSICVFINSPILFNVTLKRRWLPRLISNQNWRCFDFAMWKQTFFFACFVFCPRELVTQAGCWGLRGIYFSSCLRRVFFY